MAKTEPVRSVVILGFPGVQALDLIGPFDVFTGASTYLQGHGREGYDVRIVSRGGRPVSTGTGLTMLADPLPDPRRLLDTVVLPGGHGVDDARRDPELMSWIRDIARHARRVVSVCTGAFLAAEAGLLDGCPATTHWAYADRLAREFPSVTVDPDPIFVRSNERTWTAAGVTAGIDLALSLVEDDHGADAAQTIARWLVLYLRRPGGQTQFAAPVWMPRARREPIREVQEAIEADPGGPHSIAELARRAAMSPRHFTRVFTDEVGEAPGAYVDRIRTEAARRLLEETDDTVTTIAARCGFGSAETLRRNFIRRLGISPDQYRKTFTKV
ncbi:transcriptional regulator containing an amidase domain and an AraC-type DNA-binding HTH domain [Mycolicibacterium phlei]|uniref:Transcriptional regulator n=1 Tax=Mycolicibacterium phlei DSM 43239 = CCUG 21000 TaxID=1226750 RepID=A0A5N5VDV8_MYCPH|nr:HTH-type transcriptional regulator CdhR [Mycolicibacterium phlei]KAB7759946.1 transcriptional regulator [Mycolicibacterium phlei DSM 43239 = CCUG 21000]KXW64315.1 transcriptional regulator [Mycolicibacterium phlei DSM 43072]KXW74641.1 transcriptional regulator [Mycolicibacterium phlei DSM 43070]KXW79243.1 transcriptional regulator [Mycolicibacterium phlei DSM 43071]VEG11283.1 transcriptional regulator containing an amidase domain and an AraC-type DNA-binding HTH domain [Mycobacteroides chel